MDISLTKQKFKPFQSLCVSKTTILFDSISQMVLVQLNLKDEKKVM